MNYVIFPEVFPRIQEEIAHYHPELLKTLQTPPSILEDTSGLDWAIAQICTYCDVLVHGVYTPEEIVRLLDKLLNRLKERRPARVTH